MTTRSKLVFAALSAVALLAFAVASASANRLESSNFKRASE